MKPIVFIGERCQLTFGRYCDNDRLALRLVTEDGEPMATVTVNLPEIELEPDELIIKDYSENEGVLDTLVEAGLLEEPHRAAICGHTLADICRPTPALAEMIAKQAPAPRKQVCT